jgi:hypothetical protein
MPRLYQVWQRSLLFQLDKERAIAAFHPNKFIPAGDNMKINNLMTATTTALVTTLCINYIAQAGTIRHDKNDLDYIDLATNYPSVGRLTLKY